MKNNRQYLMAQESEARNRYLSANGKSNWAEAAGQFSGDGWEDANAWAEAAGAAMPPMMSHPAAPAEVLDRSEPLIIQVVNNSTSAIPNVILFNSNNCRTLPAPYFQNNTNVAITSNIVGVSYVEMLANSEAKPYKVGETLIVSSSAGQVEQTVGVIHKTDTGKLIQYVITPVIDPYQFQTGRVVSNYEYIIDGYTQLQINQLNASATVTIYLYLKKRYSPTQQVAGGNSNMNYGNPGIMRSISQGR